MDYKGIGLIARRHSKSFAMIMTASQVGATVMCASEKSEKRVQRQASELGVTVQTMVNNK